MNSEAKIADLLLSIKAVQLNRRLPFFKASGLHFTTFINKHIIGSLHLNVINLTFNSLKEEKNRIFQEVKAICGVVFCFLLGIIVPNRMGMPYTQVKLKIINHRFEKQIEGACHSRLKAIFVEDFISTSKFYRKVLTILKLTDCNNFSLCSYSILVEMAKYRLD